MAKPILTKNDERLEKIKKSCSLIVKLLSGNNKDKFAIIDFDDIRDNMLKIAWIGVLKSGMTRSQRKIQLNNVICKLSPEQIVKLCEKSNRKIFNSPYLSEKPVVVKQVSESDLVVDNDYDLVADKIRPMKEVVEGDDKHGPLIPYRPFWKRGSYDKKEDNKLSPAGYKKVRNILDTLSVARNERLSLKVGSNKMEVLHDNDVIIVAYSVTELHRKIQNKYAGELLGNEFAESRLVARDNELNKIFEESLEELAAMSGIENDKIESADKENNAELILGDIQ